MKGLRFNKVLTIVIMNILVFLLLLCPISVYADSLYQYEYDDSNRLISITQSDGTKIRFEYDENGNLVKQKVGGIVVTAGSSHGLQLKGNGTVWAWGANTYGQIGDGTTKAKSTAVQVNGLSGITRTAAGGNHSLALKNDGTVWAWGLNTDGELGDGTTTNRTSPVQIPNLTSVIAITAGSNYSMAVKDDGTVWAWGNNSNGKLGDGTTARRTSPVQVKSLNSIIEISAGESHTLALRADGSIWVWGSNNYGQLGNGTTVNQFTAIQVPGMSGVAEVAAGRYYSMALKKDGTVWTWGHNVYGQLGDGTFTSTNIPAPVQGLTGVKHISASVNEQALSLVVKQDGTVWSWGANTYGQIGDGTMMLRWNPVQVIGLSGVERIATGDYYNLAMKADGSVWAWGLNSSGQLGNGSTINSSVPIATVMNTAPIVTLTTPSGSQTNPTPTRVTRPTIVWNQEDAALTTFSAIQVQLFDETTTLIYDSGIVEQNVTGSVGDFTVPVDLPEGKLQVRVKVSDGTKWSEWSDSRWMLIDTMIDITPMVAAGSSHSLELKSDGTVWAWGANTYGQIGDGSTTTKSTAVQVNGLSGITRTAAGGNHSLALKNDGTVWAWGLNTDGELGDGTTTNRTSPVQIPNLTSVIAITAGSNYSMAVKDDGTVWAWGNNSNGKLGDGTTARRTSPVQVKSLNSIIEISAGESHTLALRNDGTIWAWGLNSNGQLGNGKNGSNSSVNTAIQVPGMSGVAEVAAGRYYSMALKKDGTVWTWGHNVYGQLGDGTSTSTNIPAPVQGLTGVKHISASVNEHALSLVVKQDGTVWSWGANTYGQIGDGTMMLRWNPVQVIGLSGVERIATGDYYNLAMKADGSVWAWGLNSSGQLGNGSTINSSVPIATVMNTAPIVTLTTPSGSQTNPTPTRVTRPTIVWNQEDAALTTFSAIQVQLFDETTTLIYDSGIVEQNVTGSVGDFTVPVDLPEGKLQVRVKVSDGTKWSEWSDSRWMLIDTMIDITPMVAAGSSHSLELKSDGTVWAWGANTYGQIGDGSTTTKSTAVQVNGLSGITRTAAGGNHSLALKNDGTVWAWGLNTDGELGDGTTTNRTSPVQIPNLTSVIAITAGSNYSMAVKDDGTVWAWGNNSNGKLGDGTTARRTSPVQVKSLNSIIEISAGESHTLALRNDGTIWAWGLNSNGQLGNGKNGSNSSVNTAIQVPGMSGVAEVAAGRYYSMALKKDGTVWTWGHNVYGQLGDGTSTSTNIPAPVQGLTGVKHISASVNEHALSLVVKQDGTVWSWGANTYGQIGDGTMMLRWNPVQVIGLSGVERIATGDYYNLAMKADGSVWAWGLNSSGQLGNGSTINSSIPVLSGN